MNKTLGFREHLVALILSGQKTVTWRLFDEKNLTAGDTVDFLNSETKKKFASVKLTGITEKAFKDLKEADWEGHEKFASDKDMYKWYSEVYNSKIDSDTMLKIIRFELIK